MFSCVVMAEQQASGFLHITWVSLGNGGVHVIARCDRCRVLAERTVGSSADEGLLDVIAVEALAAHGCAHAGDVVATGTPEAEQSGARLRRR